MNKTLKNILIVLGVLIGIILAVIAIFLGYITYKSSESYMASVTERAVKANDPSICHRHISQITWHPEDTCYSKVAIENKDLTACFNRGFGQEEYWRWTCFDDYFNHYQTTDLTVCNVISDQSGKDECLFQQFLSVYDPSICSLIKASQKQSSCYVHVATRTRDIRICNNHMPGQQEADICYESVAGALNDAAICEKIVDLNLKEQCKRVIELY